MRTCFYLSGLIAVCILATPAVNGAAEQQPLQAIPIIASSRFCYGDSEVFSVLLKVRIRFVNRTASKLILDKEIGTAWYGIDVAQDRKDLAEGKYEYSPNIDWLSSVPDKLQKRPSLGSPAPDFAILAPGQEFQTTIDAGVVAHYLASRSVPGTLQPGVHLFQMRLSAWTRSGPSEEFKKRWRRFGQLVDKEIKTEPLEIRIPPDPKVDKCN